MRTCQVVKQLTHIVALEWLDIADTGRSKYHLYRDKAEYVDFEWFAECVNTRQLLDSSEYSIMLGEEETRELMREKEAYWDAQNLREIK
jgi:hypothetical protein